MNPREARIVNRPQIDALNFSAQRPPCSRLYQTAQSTKIHSGISATLSSPAPRAISITCATSSKSKSFPPRTKIT